MWRSKKFIIIVSVVAAIVLVGSLTGVALAQTGSAGSSGKTLLARVAEILGIDQQKVEDAVAQAQSEMQNEALDNYLKNLVDKGTITQAQADQYKAWIQSKPDMSQYEQQLKDWQQSRPDIPSALKDWQQAQPNIPLPGAGALGRLGGRMGGIRGFFWGR
jgi:myosin heavy subunit